LREQIAQLQQELDNLRNDQAARSNDAAAFKQREQELLDRISQLESQLKVHIHHTHTDSKSFLIVKGQYKLIRSLAIGRRKRKTRPSRETQRTRTSLETRTCPYLTTSFVLCDLQRRIWLLEYNVIRKIFFLCHLGIRGNRKTNAGKLRREGTNVEKKA
jgi:hypothetical protein